MLEIREAYPCRRAEGQASGERSRGGCSGVLPVVCALRSVHVCGAPSAPPLALLLLPNPPRCTSCPVANAGTSVELEAESQVEVAQLMEDRGQVVVGWYHSHPVFEARPSQKGGWQLLLGGGTGWGGWVGGGG